MDDVWTAKCCLIPPRLFVTGVAYPDEVIKPKESTWEEVRSKLHMVNGVANYEDPNSGQRLPLLVSRAEETLPGNITSEKVPMGIVS